MSTEGLSKIVLLRRGELGARSSLSLAIVKTKFSGTIPVAIAAVTVNVVPLVSEALLASIAVAP